VSFPLAVRQHELDAAGPPGQALLVELDHAGRGLHRQPQDLRGRLLGRVAATGEQRGERERAARASRLALKGFEHMHGFGSRSSLEPSRWRAPP
jgi:hypothetical protein